MLLNLNFFDGAIARKETTIGRIRVRRDRVNRDLCNFRSRYLSN
ncbi:hypothetical protein CKA32_003006 [Geitlerinema sp. FC II]|nr:hypothetical protein CKA32_003006 [Geitlerinema sp. FC II]